MKFTHFLTCLQRDLHQENWTLAQPDSESVDKLPALILAYVGDAVFSLHLRCAMLSVEANKIQILHTMLAKMTSAPYQAYALRLIEEDLTEKEKSVLRRGRNSKSRVPKNSSIAEYRSSTGLEALLGYLYLDRQHERLSDLLNKIDTAVYQKLSLESRGESPL